MHGDSHIKKELFVGSASSEPVSQRRREQDDALDAVSRNLTELHEISITMGESLDAQNDKLDSICTKTEKANDATLEVLIKSSQLVDRNSSIKPLFLGEYCFEIHTGGYLGVQDETLVIGAPIKELSTIFRCYRKGDIFALQNIRTLKFLATGYFTPASVCNLKFNKAAHIFLDLSGEYSGILMLSCNWGSGGWIKYTPGSSDFKLTSSLRDKDGRVLFRAVPIPPKDINQKKPSTK